MLHLDFVPVFLIFDKEFAAKDTKYFEIIRNLKIFVECRLEAA
jgi:hypothetical protein